MRRLLAALFFLAGPLAAQQERITVIDSIVVEGNRRVPAAGVIAEFAIPTGRPITYREVQRGIENLFQSGNFGDITVSQGTVDGKEILRIQVAERPLLTGWTIRGASRTWERSIRNKVTLIEGRPYNASEAQRSLAAADSVYKREGYYLATAKMVELPQGDGTIRVVFEFNEGRRVAVSQVIFEGNENFSDDELSGRLKTKPEGFFWWQKGTYNDEQIERDLRERLPEFYGSKGYPDFQVLRDTLVVHEQTGKGTLIVSVQEGDRYEVGNLEIIGNRRFSTEQLEQFFPFTGESRGFLGLGGKREGPAIFNQTAWTDATTQVRTAYSNNGYIYAQVSPILTRRTTPEGRHIADLRWQIQEGLPAVVNRVLIVGNTTTHEDVIRRAITIIPGDIFRQDALIQSYQSVSNLGFFAQPMPVPETRPINEQGDVDIIFRVEEKRAGNINFGVSLGQGTGLGGFIGLQEPNLMGRGKNISFQWQFGQNINDFQVSYTDPAILGSLYSGTVSLHKTQLRYTVADLGRISTQGGSVRVGIPLFGSRFTRLFTTYTLEDINYDSPRLTTRFACRHCVLSAMGASVVRDTRIGLPFATGGTLQQIEFSQGGDILQGSGNYRRGTLEGRWYAPLGQLGGSSGLGGGGVQFVLGYTAKTGFVWGDPGPHFRQLFTLGGVQFGIPLRGYDEFSITPAGFDPNASGASASTVEAFGQSYFTMTGEVGMRVSQMLYLSAFMDAGNVWAKPGQFNPTRLFRSAGIGASVISPLGPMGIDLARGFDRTDEAGRRKPGWQVHFRLGNFF